MITSNDIIEHRKIADKIENTLLKIARRRAQIRAEGTEVRTISPILKGHINKIEYNDVMIENPNYENWSDDLNDYDNRKHIYCGRVNAAVEFIQYGSYGYVEHETETFDISILDDPDWETKYIQEIADQRSKEAKKAARAKAKQARDKEKKDRETYERLKKQFE